MSKISPLKRARRKLGGIRVIPSPVFREEQLFDVIRAPHVSEKSTRVADKNRQIVFVVRCDASKPQIRQAVEKIFKVQVESVTVSNVQGKRKQSGRIAGRRQDWKKAYVRLKPGQDIDFAGAQ